MVDFLKISAKTDAPELGKSLTSWVYRSKRSSSFAGYFLGLVAALVIFLMLYGRQFIPLLDKIPDMLLYVLIFAAGPMINLIKGLGKDRLYDLYENGFTITPMSKGSPSGDVRVGYWSSYSGCTYTSNAVILTSAGTLKGRTRLMVNANVVAIYSLCRERISIAQVKRVTSMNPMPTTPNTAEQRKLKSYEQRRASRPSGRSWRA